MNSVSLKSTTLWCNCLGSPKVQGSRGRKLLSVSSEPWVVVGGFVLPSSEERDSLANAWGRKWQLVLERTLLQCDPGFSSLSCKHGHNMWAPPCLFVLMASLICSTGVETQGLACAREALYPWAPPPASMVLFEGNNHHVHNSAECYLGTHRFCRKTRAVSHQVWAFLRGRAFIEMCSHSFLSKREIVWLKGP